MADLTDIKGIGPSAAKKLKDAGIKSIEELSELDLRQVDVEGLSNDNLSKLRRNANRFLEAQSAGDLKLVDGLGPSAEKKLKKAGVESIDDLLELDLRQRDVEGLSTENLQKLKRNARYLKD